MLYNKVVILIGWLPSVILLYVMIFNWQDGFTPFECAMEKERSKIVKYFVEEIKVNTTVYDEVISV